MKSTIIMMFALLISMPPVTSLAADDRSLRAERHEAQKQRQQQRNERNRQNSDAFAEFRDYARDLKQEYREKARDMDTEYRLRKVDLKAQRDMKIAEAEVEMQQSTTQLLLNPQAADNKEALDKLKADMQAHADKVFAIKKQAAKDEHDEYIDNENKKHKSLSERDQKALDKARSLGLMTKHQPIRATPIGGALTRQEQQWNKREQKEVERLYKNNMRQLAEFINGSKLREWEINNKQEDFKLKWDKKSELHALKNEQNFYNIIMGTSSGDMQARQQEMSKNLAELSKRTRVINIKYKNIGDRNRIARNKQRREIMGY